MSDLGNKEVFSNNLRRHMELRDLNRADLANLLQCPYSTVNDWYNGNTYPRIDMIERLANIFKVSKADLIESDYGDLSSTQKYLMDRIAKADEKKANRYKRLMELVDEEETSNW